jgi:hypothetical protein
MSKPESRGPCRAPLRKARVDAFFRHLGRTGSATVAAIRADAHDARRAEERRRK